MGTTNLWLFLTIPNRSDTFAINGPLQGTITYDFTPAVAVSERGSLGLLSAGLVGFAFMRRRWAAFKQVMGTPVAG
jgi:hypothetical protein